MASQRPGPASGFTLLELIFVAAIIGVLLAILIPSLASSRQSSRQLKCGTNLRSLAIATVQYADANRDLIPVAESPWNRDTRLVRPIVAQPFEALHVELGDPGDWSKYSIAHCPSDDRIGPVIGFGYFYLPAGSFGFLSDMTPEARCNRLREVQVLYRSDPSFVFLWSDIDHGAHAGTRQKYRSKFQLSARDGSVSVATSDIPMDADFWLNR